MDRTLVRLNRSHRRPRLLRTLAVAVLVAACVGFLAGRASAGARASGSSAPVAAKVYVVRPGDTVWGIALKIVGPSRDPRPMMDTLLERNHIVDGLIRPGERLRVP